MAELHPSARVFDLISGMMRTQTIAAIAALGVADAIAAGVTGTDALAREVGADADALSRMLRLLEADGLVARDAPDVWRLTETGELLRDGVENSMRHLAMFFASELYDAWAGAESSLRGGPVAFSERFGMPFFDWVQTHPDMARRFDLAMSGTTAPRLVPLLERDWTSVATVVDVGGGNAALLETVLTRFPQLEGVSFDLPGVSERAAARLAGSPVAGRLRTEGGDFFEAVPGGGDAYVLAQVLHDWPDEACLRLLRACRRAAGERSVLLVLEQLVPDGAEPSPVKLLDLNMLILLGGRERTRREYETLFAAAGWKLTDVRAGPRSSLLEAVPE
jgi:DNA-binding HxlR family transcriptional regulator